MNRVYPPQRGATGRILRDLAKSFSREGWQVTVITTGPNPGRERDGGVRVIRVKSRGKPKGAAGYAWLWLKMLTAGLRHVKSDILVTMSDPPLLVVAGQIIRGFRKDMRHINWCHDLYPDILPSLDVKLPGFVMHFLKSLSRRAMKKTDKMIVIGRCMARYLAYEGMSPKQITMIPNWPNLELIRASGQAPSRPKLNGAPVPENLIQTGPKFRVLYAGNLGRAHPAETILQAAEILAPDHPEIEFVFAGDGPRFDDIARRRDHLHLDNIRLLPYQPSSRLRQLLESGDLHLISVKHEAAGMLVPCKLYSALSIGRPCIFIGPRRSEAAKVIRDFKAGSIVAQGEAKKLAEEIKRYRFSEKDWFAAREGAAKAAQIYVPEEAINAWIERAWSVIEPDIEKRTSA